MIIDGKAIANQRLEILRNKILASRRSGQETKIKPKLAIILIGDDPASKIYVSLKVKTARELGIDVEVRQDLNTDADGIIIQMPGPQKLADKIPLEKDVDGLRKNSPFLPAGVRGILAIIRLLRRPAPRNDTWVIVGQGKLIGKPLADYLEKNNYNVIHCDEFTKDLKTETYKGDILVCATGVAGLITADMVKPGAVVIDCGSPKPEVDFENVKNVAGAITPVPGGVGPMTVACLLENLIEAVKI